MIHRILRAAAVLILLSTGELIAQDEPSEAPASGGAEEVLPMSSVEVELKFSSNYVFRGYDFYSNYAVQNHEAYGSHSGAWVFTPSITISPPAEGLWINFFSAFALQGRQDVDVDRLIQSGPGGADLLSGLEGADAQIAALAAAAGSPTTPAEAIAAALRPGDGSTGKAIAPDCSSSCLPGYYKEAVGLKRLDEIDLGIGYERETSLGLFALQYYIFNGGNPSGAKGDDYYAYSEVGLGYAPPFLTQLRFNIFMNASSRSEAESAGYAPAEQNYQYYQLAYSDSAALSDSVGLDYSLSAGYGIANRLQGWQDISASIALTLSGFSLGLNGSYRPDLRWYDTDQMGKGADGLPVWLVGGSTRADGLVEDPSKINDPVQRVINATLSQTISAGAGFPSTSTYVYTQRQRLPRLLYWISVAYSFQI
ncbi:MAG: hypothetical protein K1X75_06035 [Leptospirales bacterium]|nr:hypothetical protein [Leptospirales bacterium]